MAIATVAELKQTMDLKQVRDEAFLQLLLDSATAFAQRFARRRFEPDPAMDEDGEDTEDPVTRSFTTRGRTHKRVPDLRVVTSVVLAGSTLTADEYDLGYASEDDPATDIEFERSAGGWNTWSGTQRNDLVITGRWGWNPVPADVRDAVLTMAARGYKERDANFADAVQTAEGGAMAYFKIMPARVQGILKSYRPAHFAVV